jgi:hypothetical protein
MKMARIFQQCAKCFEKESSVTTVAGLVNSFGTRVVDEIFCREISRNFAKIFISYFAKYFFYFAKFRIAK